MFTSKVDFDPIDKVTGVAERSRSNSPEILTPGTNV